MKTILLFSSLISFYCIAQNTPLGKGYEFINNGKTDTILQHKTYKSETLNKSIKINNIAALKKGIEINNLYLNKIGYKKYYLANGVSYSTKSIKATHKKIVNKDSLNLLDFKLYKLKGEDSKSSVHYTSYFIPTIEVSKTKDSIYKYPIYKKPSSSYLSHLSRYDIDVLKKLSNKNLELAYAKSYFDLFSMMVQGSGYVKYKDGTTKLFSYGGKNGKSYYSIGRYLVEKEYLESENLSLNIIDEWFKKHPDSTHIFMMNSSYVFFNPTDKKVSGAAGVPLINHVSVAADFKYLPKGSLLLGKVPVLNTNGVFTHHVYQILIVHDTGGAIKGPGHIDLYAGVGEEGRKYASAMHHYGQLWLILPK